jgi:aspartyl protease
MGRAQVLQLAVHPQHGLVMASLPLRRRGCNLQVEVGTASAFVSDPTQRQSITLWAHLDTGASQTTISSTVAAHLGLAPLGIASAHTAGGRVANATYAIDLAFVGTTLAPRVDLSVGSCSLPFDLATHATTPNEPTNFGLLIGRDVMSSWHIAWDGPSSMVFITE